MKKFLKHAVLLTATALCLGLTGCSDDDDPDGNIELWKGELAAPKYESDAAIYTVTGAAAGGIRSIELTESGNYIITKNNGYAYDYRGDKRQGLFKSKLAVKRSARGGGNYLFGTYTKLADGSFDLDGFGVMSYGNGDLDLRLDNGSSIVVAATKSTPAVDADALNTRLCRTWWVKEAKEQLLNENGKVVKEHKYSQAEIKEELVQYVIVSRAGSWIQVDWDGDIDGIGRWSWTDKTEQIFHWSEGYDNGYVQVAFNDKKASFIEEFEEEDEDDGEYYVIRSIVTAEAH